MPVILSTAQIQDVFDIKSSGTMSKIKGRGADTAIVGRNSWDLKLFLDWWLDNMADSAMAEAGDETLTEARRQYWQAKAERERLRADQEAGGLIPADDVFLEWAARISFFRQALDNLTDRLPPLLLGKDRLEMRSVICEAVEYIAISVYKNSGYCPAAVKDLARMDEWIGLTDAQRRAEVQAILHKEDAR